ncbi:hypothetical protein NDU88_005310 [Pleurodeles waltl]|uniref:Uncharacterized protein n=1 Tax=Pleurodeles waltl TaxID=8319 RepID=A0AAV7RKQ1_PLEWA|nr:hypothetical protein NDU88_005310 [Pleurodeles waltl]
MSEPLLGVRATSEQPAQMHQSPPAAEDVLTNAGSSRTASDTPTASGYHHDPDLTSWVPTEATHQPHCGMRELRLHGSTSGQPWAESAL